MHWRHVRTTHSRLLQFITKLSTTSSVNKIMYMFSVLSLFTLHNAVFTDTTVCFLVWNEKLLFYGAIFLIWINIVMYCKCIVMYSFIIPLWNIVLYGSNLCRILMYFWVEMCPCVAVFCIVNFIIMINIFTCLFCTCLTSVTSDEMSLELVQLPLPQYLVKVVKE